MHNYGETIYACECRCGVTFDFRAKEGHHNAEFTCPFCGAKGCKVRGTWKADDGGYHTTKECLVLLAEDRQKTLDRLYSYRVRFGELPEEG